MSVAFMSAVSVLAVTGSEGTAVGVAITMATASAVTRTHMMNISDYTHIVRDPTAICSNPGSIAQWGSDSNAGTLGLHVCRTVTWPGF